MQFETFLQAGDRADYRWLTDSKRFTETEQNYHSNVNAYGLFCHNFSKKWRYDWIWSTLNLNLRNVKITVPSGRLMKSFLLTFISSRVWCVFQISEIVLNLHENIYQISRIQFLNWTTPQKVSSFFNKSSKFSLSTATCTNNLTVFSPIIRIGNSKIKHHGDTSVFTENHLNPELRDHILWLSNAAHREETKPSKL